MGERARRRLARRSATWAAVVVWAAGAAWAQEPRYEDARPPSAPPGFEPVDVREEVQQQQREQARELLEQAEIDRYYRTLTPETRIRARYGSATWDLYDPYH